MQCTSNKTYRGGRLPYLTYTGFGNTRFQYYPWFSFVIFENLGMKQSCRYNLPE